MTWPRPLASDERHILDVLLSPMLDGGVELRAQAEVVLATGHSCPCGCPSIALEVDRSAPPASVNRMVTEGVGIDADGNIVGVMLFVDRQGYMYDLEVFAYGGTLDGRTTEGAWGWPTKESFEPVEWEPHGDGRGATLMNDLHKLKRNA